MNENKNMYSDSKYQWNVFKGCEFECLYCIPSFQRQAKRQMPTIDKNGNKRGCQDCYDYKPHFHPERLGQSLPRTEGDEFIWACSSGDVSFAKEDDLNRVLDVMRLGKNEPKTFFMQSKDPQCFNNYDLPENLIIGTTIESNRDHGISKAPTVWSRKMDLERVDHPRKSVTIEPIMKFDLDILLLWMKHINPERIYVGYDTKNCKLPEPTRWETMLLMEDLRRAGFKVKEKLIRKAWDEV